MPPGRPPKNGMPTEKKVAAKKKCYRMPEKIPMGEVLTDTKKTSWVLHKSIGIGGFGEIYDAIMQGDSTKKHFVVKIEPIENGPLFCERAVYLNIGKKEQIEEFMKLKKIKYLGLPAFYGFGSHKVDSIEYRFIVIQKLGQDIQSLFQDCGHKFPIPTVLKISVQILYVLEYMHSRGYVHCDIKGGNLLLSEDKNSNQVYLVDLGLACKFQTMFKKDPKKSHNGTLEYTSRDLHEGAPTRRGDLEILAYNMLEWSGCALPWKKLKVPADVQKKKVEAMNNPTKLVSTCFNGNIASEAIKDFFIKVSRLEPTEEPCYDEFRSILTNELKKTRCDVNKLDFKNEVSSVPSSPRKSSRLPENTSPSGSRDDGERNAEKSAKPIKLRAPKVATPKRSWRDCPTILNGGGADYVPSKKREKKII